MMSGSNKNKTELVVPAQKHLPADPNQDVSSSDEMHVEYNLSEYKFDLFNVSSGTPPHNIEDDDWPFADEEPVTPPKSLEDGLPSLFRTIPLIENDEEKPKDGQKKKKTKLEKKRQMESKNDKGKNHSDNKKRKQDADKDRWNDKK